MKIENLEQLFSNGLQYVYDAEKQLTEALPEMAKSSSTPQLRQAFESHLQETKEHVTRLEKIFQQLGQRPETKPNSVLSQMRQEANQMIANTDQSPVRDAALIVAGTQVEHYEMSAYGSLSNFAQLLGKGDIAQILQQTLSEEKKADEKLTQIGESQVNQQSLRGATTSARA